MEIPQNNEDYRKLEYWDERYKEEESYDWFTGYDSFRHLLVQDVNKSDRILHLGNAVLCIHCLSYRFCELVLSSNHKISSVSVHQLKRTYT